MRLARSTLGLRDGYGDRDRMKRDELLPRLQTGHDSIVGTHPAYLMTSSPHENIKQPILVGAGASPMLDEPRTPDSGRRRKLSHKLSIKSFRQWIQNQRRPAGSTPIAGESPSSCKTLESGLNPDSMTKAGPSPGGMGGAPVKRLPESESAAAVRVARVSSVISRKKSGRLGSEMMLRRGSLSPASSGTGSEEVRTPAAEGDAEVVFAHQYHFPKPPGESILLARSSPPPPYRSPVQFPARRIPTRHPSLPSSVPHHHPPSPSSPSPSPSHHRHHLLRSRSSVPHLNLTHSAPPSYLLSLPACSVRFGIPCVIDMASNSPPLRQPIPTLRSSSPLTDDAPTSNQSNPRIPLPARDDLSIVHAGPGVGNRVTDLDHRLPQLDNLNLSPVINKIIQSSTPVSPAPSSPSSCDPQPPSRVSQPSTNPLITNSLLSPERPLSIVEEDPPPDQAASDPLTPTPPLSNGLSSVPMLEPNPPAQSLTNGSLSTIHAHQIVSSEITSSSPTRSPAGYLPESTSPIPDRLSSSGPSSRFVKSAATTKVDVSHKHAETQVAAKLPGPAEKKSVFGKLFDRRNDAKSAGVGGSTSTEGSGNESDPNTLGVGTGIKKPVTRKTSTKVGGHASDVGSNPGSAALNEPEGISGPRLMALQGSIAPQHTGAKSKNGSERGGEDKPFGGSSKLRDMVGGKLGRKPSSSKGGRSEDGKSDDGENRSRAGSQATTSLLKKYGVCEKAAIGKGATAVVRLAHKWDRGTDKLYAVKEFRKRRKNESEKEYVKKLTSEFCISSTLHHENIVETVDLVQDENQHWCEVMEYCPGGDLYAAIKRGSMKQQEINSYFKQLLNGIAYLHQMGVAHRDIKPENLLLDGKGRIKITDFGVSDVFRMCWEKTAHLSKGLCGSEPYLPKEIFERKEYDARLIDVWSCGIVYYCCCIQELPWRVAKKTDPSYMSFVESYESSLTPTPLINLTKDSRKIIKKMLHPEPEGRVQIDDVLQDEWVAGLQVLAV